MPINTKLTERLAEVNEKIRQIDPDIVMSVYTWMNDSSEMESDFIKLQINAADLERYAQVALLAHENQLSGAELFCHYQHARARHDLKRIMVTPMDSDAYLQVNAFYDGTDQLQQTHEIPLSLLTQEILQAQKEGRTDVALYGQGEGLADIEEAKEAFATRTRDVDASAA